MSIIQSQAYQASFTIFKSNIIAAFLIILIGHTSYAIDWNTVPIIQHSDYQSIRESPAGSGNWTTAFGGPLPFRLIGVVLNDNEDYLDPTAHYDNVTPWYLGGQAQIYVQAVNLDGTQWNPDPNTPFNDFSGTACWMGQNYGNLGFIGDPQDCYYDQAWYDELNSLQLWHPNTPGLPAPVAQPVRKGDLVEINTSIGGMYYSGMMNVNEQHSIDLDNDFQIVVLQHNYGMPDAAQLTLGNLKNADNSFIFNPAAPRDSGAEHYQSALVQLTDVRLTNPLLWGPNMDLKLTDDSGRDIDVHLGLDVGFYSYMAPAGTYDVAGIIDQASANGRDGYRLMTLEASNFSALPGVAAPVWYGGGGDAHWKTTANWIGPSLTSDWELHFDGSTNLNSVNDYDYNTSFYGIVFNPNAAAFTLSGNTVKVKRVANFSSSTQIVDLSLNTDDANCLFLAEPGNILVSEPITGANGIEKYGSADLTLTAVNAYTGTTDVEAGRLLLSDGGTIDASSGILVASGATLEIDGGEHHLAAISGEGDTIISVSAQVTVDSIVQNTLTMGAGCTLTIAPISGGLLSSAESLRPVPEPNAMLILLLGLSNLTAYGIIRRK
jgi:autotransporter-associated beta strand protein